MRIVPVVVLSALLILAAPSFASSSWDRQWQGPGIVVSSFNLQNSQITVVDSGAVVCHNAASAAGSGGNCLPFAAISGGNNAIGVRQDCDLVCPANVLTFQVCVDNNGDGLCRGLSDINDDQPMHQPPNCGFDSVFYSHSTATTKNRAALYIPPWAQSFWQSCGGVGYPGYVVIICAGAHNNRANTQPHVHTATSGVLSPVVTTDLSSGNYCGAPTAAKAYVVV